MNLLGPRGKVALLVLVAAIIQEPVLDRFQVARAHPDLLLLLPVLAGLFLGPTDGAWVGFVAGLAADLSLPTSLGLSALVLTLTGFAVGSIVQALIEGPWWVVPLVGAVGTAIGEVLHVVVAAVTGQDLVLSQPEVLVSVIGVASAANAVLALPVGAAMRWVAGARDPVRAGAA